MKKAAKGLLLTVICSCLLVPAAKAQDVNVDSVKVRNDKVTVTGSAAKANEYVTMTVLKKEGESENVSDILTVGQQMTNEDGSFEISFFIPEMYEQTPTDADYIITLHLNNSLEKTEYEIAYVSLEDRNEFLEILKTKPAKDIIAAMKSSESYRDGFELEGANAGEFLKIPQDSGERLLDELLSDYDRINMTLESFAPDFNKLIYFNEVNTGVSDMKEALSEYNFSFEGAEFNSLDAENQDFIVKSMSEAIPFDRFADFERGYASASVLLELNGARYSDIDKIMSKYEKELGLDGDTAYKKYTGLSNTKKQSVWESVVKTLDKNKAYTAESYRKVLEDAVDSLPSGGSSGTGGSGGSGGGGGGGLPSGQAQGASSNEKDKLEDKDPGGVTAVEADIKETADRANFDDLDAAEWAQEAILSLARRGIISGRGGNKFDPNGIITREEFVKIIVDAAGVRDDNAKSAFEDVVPGSWYERYVASAAAEGLVSGKSENVFGVGEPITRQDVCVIAAKLIDGKDGGAELAFDDTDEIADYARQSVKKLLSLGIISGMGENKFCPEDTCTRAQAAYIVWGILGKE